MIKGIKQITISQIDESNTVLKGWGKEIQIVNHTEPDHFPLGYSGKILVYSKRSAKSSMHYHVVKHETFFVLQGGFTLLYYNPDTAELKRELLIERSVVDIPPYNPHQLVCNSDEGRIIEFASTDYNWDNYRIGKGDSQA
jgi:hypothetical protein